MTASALAMVPARIGSQRLAQKNLQPFNGKPLLRHAVDRCQAAGVFDEVWVNTDADLLAQVAAEAGVPCHRRPEALGGHDATSEDYIAEFLAAHPCDWLVQVHSIAPLLSPVEIRSFVERLRDDEVDVLLSVVDEQIECVCDGRPVNFRLDRKTNSQELSPVRRITWSISAWRAETFLAARQRGECATYAGRIGYHSVSRAAGHIVKTADDLAFAHALQAALAQ